MDEHHCLLCMGSNTNRYAQLSVAREALRATFPDIHFGEMMETEAVGSGFHSPFSNQLAKFSTTLSPDSVHDLFKELERRCGRIPEDKAQTRTLTGLGYIPNCGCKGTAFLYLQIFSVLFIHKSTSFYARY